MEDLPRFTYFDDPVGYGAFVRSEQACLCCGERRGWIYTDLSLGTDREDKPLVCPWCIVDGSASRAWKNANFNHVDNSVPAAAREEIERRTPHVSTWQQLEWPVCCGDACVFRGQAQYKQLTETWPEAGRALLATFQTGWLGTQTPEEFLGWFKSECDPGAYAFTCRHCRQWRVEWDIS